MSRSKSSRKKSVRNKSKARRRSTKRQVIPPLRHGTLSKYGYHNVADLTVAERHRALEKAIKGLSHATVIHKLSAVAVLQRNTNPRMSRIFQIDQRWVSRQLAKSKSTRRVKSRARSRK